MKILILQSSLKKTSEECRNSVRAREGLPRQAKQICFPDISIVPIAVLSSITALPTSLRKDRTSSVAPITEATKEPVQPITSEL